MADQPASGGGISRWADARSQALPRLVARLPLPVHVKLLAAFLVIAGLLVAVSVASLGVLGAANRRTDDLVAAQRKLAAYRQVQHDTTEQLLGVSGALLSPDASTLDSTLRQLNQFGYDLDRLQFVARDEQEILGRVQTAYDEFIGVVTSVVGLAREGRLTEARDLQLRRAGPLADALERLTNELVNKAESDIAATTEKNASAFSTSRLLVIAVATASVILALGLGYSISWSVIRPVKAMDARLREIASGDFSRSVAVANRDELGALAENLNRMNSELSRLYDELEGRNRDLGESLEQQTATSEILSVIAGSPTDVQPVLDAVCERAAKLLGSHRAAIRFVSGDRVILAAAYGIPDPGSVGSSIRLSTLSYVGKVVLENRPLQVLDMATEPVEAWPDAEPSLWPIAGTMMIVPLQKERAAIGAINVWRGEEVRPFSDREMELLKTFADQAVIAIENVRLFNEIEQRNRDLGESLEQQTATSEVLGIIAGSPTDLQPVLEAVAERAAKICGASDALIFLVEAPALRLAAHYGSLATPPVGNDFPLDRGMLGARAVIDGRLIHVDDMAAEPESEYAISREIQRQYGYRTIMAAPLLREGTAIGSITVRRDEVLPFSERQVEMLKTFADQAVIAIENVRLFHEIEEKNRELEVASRHKSEFLANMSHELRTPLNAIIGFSEVLIARMFGELGERQEEYLKDILTSGQMLLSLINDILDLSKVEAGHMELELAEFSLRQALDNSLMMVRERATNHGIRLSLSVEDGVDVIEADERKVKQVLFNLLTNAVKFTERGRIDVTVRREDDDVAVAVKDTGIGIAPEDQALIFEEFRQVGRSHLRKQEGTGLGLSLAKMLVELHGGRISVESEVGAGSTFTFAIPLRQTPAAAAGADGAGAVWPPSPGDGAAPTILVVEDNPASAELLTLYLRSAGFRVELARDGEEGLAMAGRLRPDGIVLDIVLPKLDGWELLGRLKADAALANTPVIIVSMLDERGRGFALGAADYLVKPVHRDDLLAALGRATASKPAVNGARVLAIDDDPMALELIEAVLRPEGYEVTCATSGEEGLRLAAEVRPALVIVDLLMPEIDGFEVVERLRADPAVSDIPIVVLTSKAMTAADKKRLNGQINHLARKGQFNRQAFVELVRSYCVPQRA